MANVYAVGNGNASVGATWNTGNIPTINDDVYTNNYTVTVDANVTWLSARNTAAAGITAGGKFLLTNGVILNCVGTGVINGTVPVIEFALANPNLAHVVSTSIASTVTNNTGVLALSNTGELNVVTTTFSCIANGGYSQSGVVVSANGTLNISCDINFQTSGNFIKVTAATPIITCNCNLLTYGNSSTNSLIGNGTLSTTATITWNGILFGSNGTIQAGSGYGINTKGICNVTGNVTGGSYSNTCHGIVAGDGATVTVNGGNISSSTIGAHAIYSTSVSNTVLVSGIINNTNGFLAINTRKLALINANPTQWLFQTNIVGTNKTLYSSDNVLLGYPVEADTRESVVYGQSGEFEGTLKVPPVNTVLLGVPTDNTVGTLVPGGATAADVWDYLTTGTVVADSTLEWLLDRLSSSAIQSELAAYDSSKGSAIKNEIQSSTDTIVSEIQKTATAQPVIEKSRPYKW